MTDPNTEDRGCDCLAGLECLLNIFRALRMGSCLSAESRNPPPGSPSAVIRKRKTIKKRSTSRNSSFDYKREEMLHRVHGRMFLNGSTEVASLFTQQGKKGTNQDAMIVWENFGSRTDTVFCGVFDGHGPFGHMVAKRVRDSLPLKLSAHWEVKSDDVLRESIQNRTCNVNSEDTPLISVEEETAAYATVEGAEKHHEIFQTLTESFLKAFRVMDWELKMYANIDCFCSGTTAVTLVKQGQDLVIGNVGDSRAVLATRDEENSLIAVQLTVDLKPSVPAEAERIRKHKGRVFALHDEPEVPRVWLPNNNSPGLAMARAFGDFCLKDFGLISVPEISYRRLTEKDQFVVLATDGIWDVLSNKEVVDIVASSPARSCAARKLVEQAVRAWRTRYPTSKVDDCAVVCLFLDSSENSSFAAATTKSKGQNEETTGQAGFCHSKTAQNEDEDFFDANMEETVEVVYNKEETSESHWEMGQEWSALEGVSRVDTMLNLPRFVPDKEDMKAAGGSKKRK